MSDDRDRVNANSRHVSDLRSRFDTLIALLSERTEKIKDPEERAEIRERLEDLRIY